MNQELKDLLALVKHSNKPGREVIESYFEDIGSSIEHEEEADASEREVELNRAA